MTLSRELLMREPALAVMMGALPQQGHNVGFGYGYGYGHGYGYGGYLPGHGWYRAGFGSSQPEPEKAAALTNIINRTQAVLQTHPNEPRLLQQLAKAQAALAALQPAAISPFQAAPPAVQAALSLPVEHPAHPVQVAKRLDLQNPASTGYRTMLLDPNRDSTIKVERYSFSFSPAANLVLGTASNIATFTQQPSTSIKGQRVVMNAPIAGFVLISTLQIANVNVLVGGTEDAFTYSAGAQGVMLDLPRLDPQNRATSAGAYTGVLPPGYTAGNSFQFIITLQGPATMAGGYGQ